MGWKKEGTAYLVYRRALIAVRDISSSIGKRGVKLLKGA